MTIKLATAIELYWLQIYNLHNTRALYYNRKALMALPKAIELYRLQIYNQFNSKSLKLQSQSIDAIAHCHLSSISKEQKKVFCFPFQVKFLEEKLLHQSNVENELRNGLKERAKLVEEKTYQVCLIFA